MRWKQFFTPVKSYKPEQARRFVSNTPLSEMTVLDVRQPKEHEVSQTPGIESVIEEKS
jgi:hypothetical protein